MVNLIQVIENSWSSLIWVLRHTLVDLADIFDIEDLSFSICEKGKTSVYMILFSHSPPTRPTIWSLSGDCSPSSSCVSLDQLPQLHIILLFILSFGDFMCSLGFNYHSCPDDSQPYLRLWPFPAIIDSNA